MLQSKYDPQQRITVAVDCIIFGFDSERLKLLLFRRKVEPFKGSWSLIGSLIKNDISLDDGAKEILFNLTGLKDVYLKQFRVYGEVNRDPVERVISVAYYSLIRINEFDYESVKDHDAKWFDFHEVPELLLDHGQMVQDAIRNLRLVARNRPLGFELLPPLFTMPQLQLLYESIYDTKFDRGNFRKKILSLGILKKTDQKDKSGSKRGAFLYKFKKDSLDDSSMINGEFDKIKEVIQF